MANLCLCFVKALGCDNAFEASLLSISERRHIYAQRSRMCHPDKQSTDRKDAATRAQTLLNLMREELIDDEETAIRYLQTGQAKAAHNCQEMTEAAEAILHLLPSTSQSPPRSAATPTRDQARDAKREPASGNIMRWLTNQRRSRETSSPPNTPRVGPSHVLDAARPTEDDDDSDVEIIKVIAAGQKARPFASPPPSPQPTKRGASPSSLKAPRKKRRKAFEPTGYQLQGITIIYNKHRCEGASYLVQWLAKPTITTWLREEDVTRHFPEACREYLTDLAHSSPRRFYNIARAAGPMSELLD